MDLIYCLINQQDKSTKYWFRNKREDEYLYIIFWGRRKIWSEGQKS